MINKIKDKQTGEVYEIGGLKCKLVEIAKLSLIEINLIEFKLSNKLDVSNKMYLIHRFDSLSDSFDMCVIGFANMYNTSATSSIVVRDDNTGFPVVGVCQYYETNNNPRIELTAYPSYSLDDFIFSATLDHDYIEIYELPFALEV